MTQVLISQTSGRVIEAGDTVSHGTESATVTGWSLPEPMMPVGRVTVAVDGKPGEYKARPDWFDLGWADIYTVYRRGDRKKKPTPVQVRTLMRKEVMALLPGVRVGCILNDGRLGDVRINGRIRTWKTDADRVEVPVKYGMYEAATFSLKEAMTRFVIELN